MKRFCFKKGLSFIELNTRWQLVRRLVTGRLQFESDQGEIKNLLDHEVLELWRSGQWSIDLETLGLESDAIYFTTPSEFSNFPLKWQEKAKRKLHYIQFVNPAECNFNADIWKRLISQAALEINDPSPPCVTSLYLWWKRYRVTQSVHDLMPRVRGGYSRKQEKRFEVFEDVVKSAYLNSQKLPVLDIYLRVKQRISILNLGRSEAEQIKQVSQSTIYRWVHQLRADISDSARLGADVARNKYRTVLGGLKVDQILERVEIDHTPLDLIVIDDNTMLPLGRPWLTLALDKYSRMVAGFYLSFNAPSSYSVTQVLKHTILPKDYLLTRYPDIKNRWPAFGIPDLIALDNGMDLHSDALKTSCLELGIQILYCPAATPQMKGSVERFFRTIHQGLIHQLPGTTFSNIYERGDYPSESKSAINLATLVHLITKWIVDVYNVTPHRGIANTPLNVWNESAKSRQIEIPVHPTSLDLITGIPARRTIFHYGIELEGLHYNSRQLQEIRKISGENLAVDLKFYEDQVQYIDVFDPFIKEYLRVEAVHTDYSENLHRESHRLARVQARKKFGEQFSMPQLAESRAEIQQLIEDALKSNKMAHRKSAASHLFFDSNAVFAKENPLKLHKKAPEPPKPPSPLESGLEDALPDLKFMKVDDNEEAA